MDLAIAIVQLITELLALAAAVVGLMATTRKTRQCKRKRRR